jgi:hypothetical protein
MFCPDGYVSLAELWKEFTKEHRALISNIARAEYSDESFSATDEFGSPDDYCEDLFLASLIDTKVFAATASGAVTRLETELDDGRSNLFLKLSVFESSFAAEDPDEAGPENFWLIRMGSSHFEGWKGKKGIGSFWKASYPVLKADECPQERQCFHTLPVAFERARFVIPEETPPWSIDVIDEHFLPRILRDFAGRALCVSTKTAHKWRKHNIEKADFLLEAILPTDADIAFGRPNTRDKVYQAYSSIFPKGHSGSLKAACLQIKNTFGVTTSTKTLQRVIKENTPKGDKSLRK